MPQSLSLVKAWKDDSETRPTPRAARAPLRRSSSGVASPRKPQDAVQSPERVNQYELTVTLGKGSFATVKLGQNREGSQFAVKVMDTEHLRKKHVLADVNEEIAILKLISHQNVCNLSEVIEDPKTAALYLVLEFLPGGSLQELLERRAASGLPSSELQGYVQQVVCGMEYLHYHKVCCPLHSIYRPPPAADLSPGRARDCPTPLSYFEYMKLS